MDGKYEGRRPSKEFPLHLAVYREREDIGCVIHATPFYATLVACSNVELKTNLFVESMYYLEKMCKIPFANPGSSELAKLVEGCAGPNNVILMGNHGVLVYDSSISEAFTGLEVLENLCRMNVTMLSAGITPCEVPPEKVCDFLNNSGYKPRRWA